MTEKSKNSSKLWTLLAIFLIILIGGIGISLKQIGDNIRQPFARLKMLSPGEGGTAPVSSNLSDIEKLVRLKTTDTDNDGLSDYDEENIYNTSVYLEDTDSDGLTDQQEITAGSDPNCPTGQDCATAAVKEASTESVPSYETLPNTGATTSKEERVLTGQAAPAEIREFLKQGGLSEADLNQLTDEMVLELYQETLKSVDTSALPTTIANINTDLSNINVSDVKSYIETLSADELKRALKDSGASDEILNGIDAETMRQMILESLNQ